ncbi:MAG: 50S ribosomal protein L10 [Bifidobacterium pseudocatenulatum]
MAKNTLIRIAARKLASKVSMILAGPTAVTFVKGDFIEAAKTCVTSPDQ